MVSSVLGSVQEGFRESSNCSLMVMGFSLSSLLPHCFSAGFIRPPFSAECTGPPSFSAGSIRPPYVSAGSCNEKGFGESEREGMEGRVAD